MPFVRYSGGATYNLRDGPTFVDGDEGDVDEETAARLCESPVFERVDASEGLAPVEGDEDADTTPPVEPEAQAPERMAEYVEDGKCGYYNPNSMDSPCSRSEGWGRDTDSGPCSQHANED